MEAAPPRNQTTLLSRKQAAEFLGFSLRTLDAYVSRGSIRSVRFGRLVKFRQDELNRVALHGLDSAFSSAAAI